MKYKISYHNGSSVTSINFDDSRIEFENDGVRFIGDKEKDILFVDRGRLISYHEYDNSEIKNPALYHLVMLASSDVITEFSEGSSSGDIKKTYRVDIGNGMSADIVVSADVIDYVMNKINEKA